MSAVQKAIGIVLDLVQVTFAILVMFLTIAYLLNVNVDVGGRTVEASCLLNGRTDEAVTEEGGVSVESDGDDVFSGVRLCVYSILVGLIACIATVIFCCVKNAAKMTTCNMCGISRAVDIIADSLLLVWWLTAFIIFARRGKDANLKGFPRQTQRNAVIGISFGAVVAFGLDIAVTVWSFVS